MDECGSPIIHSCEGQARHPKPHKPLTSSLLAAAAAGAAAAAEDPAPSLGRRWPPLLPAAPAASPMLVVAVRAAAVPRDVFGARSVASLLRPSSTAQPPAESRLLLPGLFVCLCVRGGAGSAFVQGWGRQQALPGAGHGTSPEQRIAILNLNHPHILVNHTAPNTPIKESRACCLRSMESMRKTRALLVRIGGEIAPGWLSCEGGSQQPPQQPRTQSGGRASIQPTPDDNDNNNRTTRIAVFL